MTGDLFLCNGFGALFSKKSKRILGTKSILPEER